MFLDVGPGVDCCWSVATIDNMLAWRWQGEERVERREDNPDICCPAAGVTNYQPTRIQYFTVRLTELTFARVSYPGGTILVTFGRAICGEEGPGPPHSLTPAPVLPVYNLQPAWQTLRRRGDCCVWAWRRCWGRRELYTPEQYQQTTIVWLWLWSTGISPCQVIFSLGPCVHQLLLQMLQ